MRTLLYTLALTAIATLPGSSLLASRPGQTSHSSSISHAVKTAKTFGNSGPLPGKGLNTAKGGKTVVNHAKGVKTTTISKAATSKFKVTKLPGTKIPNYHLKFGTKFSKGILYKGKNHHHWGFCCWNPGYGCIIYWDPFCLCWYYWCEIDFCYYPVCYVPYGCYVSPARIVVEPAVVEVLPVAYAATNGSTAPQAADPAGDVPPIPDPVAVSNP
jgi:hypothetical protein